MRVPDPVGLDMALDDCVHAAGDEVPAQDDTKGKASSKGKHKKDAKGGARGSGHKGAGGRPWSSGHSGPPREGRGNLTVEELQSHKQRSATPKAVLNSWSCAVFGAGRRLEDVQYITGFSGDRRKPWKTTVCLSGRHWDEQESRRVAGSPRASKLAAEQCAAQHAVQRMDLRALPSD